MLMCLRIDRRDRQNHPRRDLADLGPAPVILLIGAAIRVGEQRRVIEELVTA